MDIGPGLSELGSEAKNSSYRLLAELRHHRLFFFSKATEFN